MRRKKLLESNATNIKMETVDTEELEKNIKSNTIKKRMRRLNVNYRKQEQQADTLRKRIKRSDPEYRRVENERNNIRKRIKRSDPLYRSIEQAADTKRKRMKRSDPEYRKMEQAANTQRKRDKRSQNNLYHKEIKVEKKLMSVKRCKITNTIVEIQEIDMANQSDYEETIMEETIYLNDDFEYDDNKDCLTLKNLRQDNITSQIIEEHSYIPMYSWDNNSEKNCETIIEEDPDDPEMITTL